MYNESMRIRIAFALILLLGPRAFAKEVVFGDKLSTAQWTEAYKTLEEGDTVHFKGATFVLGKSLGSGSYGTAFVTDWNGSKVAIKIPRTPNRSDAHGLLQQKEQLERLDLAKAKVATPLPPSNEHFLLMKLIEGDRLWLALTSSTPDERLNEIKKIVAAVSSWERAGALPQDMKNLVKNVVRSREDGEYYLVDPGGLVPANGKQPFPNSIALFMEPKEVKLAEVLLFQHRIERGLFPDSARTLRGVPVLNQRNDIHPLWQLELQLSSGKIIDRFVRSHFSPDEYKQLGARTNLLALTLKSHLLKKPGSISAEPDRELITNARNLIRLPTFDDADFAALMLRRLVPSERTSFRSQIPQRLKERVDRIELDNLPDDPMVFRISEWSQECLHTQTQSQSQ